MRFNIKITENYASVGDTPTKKNSRIYIAGFEIYEDFSSGDITKTLSLIEEGNRFVMIENSSISGTLTRYQHPNHQGSTTLETDESGNIITYEEYHPFGTTSYQDTNGSVTAAAKRYRYTGMERDDETGLEYHNARYYIPWLGRWMNCDPIGIGDGVNVYAYCRNNPVGNVDTEGTQTEEAEYKPADKKDPYGINKQIPVAKMTMNQLIKHMAIQGAREQAKRKTPVPDKAYGPADREFWLTKDNYNPERAHLAETKKLADKEGGATSVAIWTSFWLGKVGEYGSPIVGLRPPGGGGAPFRLPQREMINKAPVENAGNGTIKAQPRPLNKHPAGSKLLARPVDDPDVNKGTIRIEQPKTQGTIIGLGIEKDLSIFKGTGATTWLNGGWQKEGLTKVNWGKAAFDEFSFKESFIEAAKNASSILFNVTNFNPSHPKPGVTNYEFNHIVNDPALLKKTTFIQNGAEVLWNGNDFIKK